MKTIRKGIFETNSSSTHAIVIPHEVNDCDYSLYDSLDHNYGFGREESRFCNNWDEKLAYAYILLKDNVEWSKAEEGWKPLNKTTEKELDVFKKRITAMWEVIESKLQIKYSPTPQDVFNYIDRDGTDGNLTGSDSFIVITNRYGNYVDHSNGLDDTDFLDRLKNDDDFLKRFIFNRSSYITIGGDEYRGYNIKTIGFEYDYDDDSIFEEKLKEYEKENDVYLKGN